MRCDQEFDSTQWLYMESFATFDADTFRRLHPEAVAILPGGGIRRGVESIMAARGRKRSVPGRSCIACRRLPRGVHVYETAYTIPPQRTIRCLSAVTHVHELGRWLVVVDQTTLVDP
jgi:hypothetical protein